MNTVNEFHSKSMDCAELAIIARMQKNNDESIRLFHESLDFELKAIAAIESESVVEPTYSILHRSAATLALDCNDVRLAEKLISKALSLDPPAEISEELRDLLEQVNFRRHLQLKGITIEDDELQMSLAGSGVGFGIVHSEQFLQRMDDAKKMIYRIVERRRKRPFREKGPPKQSVKDDYEVFISVPRAASFAVTLKLGHPTVPPVLPGILDSAADIVDEFMELMSLINKAQTKEIEARIPDIAYRRNFIKLAQQLAPDGENVKIVGFTSVRRGQEQFVEVTRPKTEIALPQPEVTTTNKLTEKITIRGALRFADAIKESGLIKIIEEETNTVHTIKVPEGMMNDIVKPLWDCHVVVKGARFEKFIMLEDIEKQ